MHKRKWTFSAALLLLAFSSACTYPGDGPVVSRAVPTKAVRRDLNVVVNTNGIIEPMERGEIYAPTEGFVTALSKMEGAEVSRGELLMRLESKQMLTALSEARSALLQARFEGQSVLTGPSKEELASAEAAIRETELQLQQRRDDMSQEEALLSKNATTRQAAERLQKECHLLELRLKDLRKKRQALLDRYTPEQKEWEQKKVQELTRHVQLLEDQIEMGTIHAPESGVLYFIPVRAGSFVSRGQLLGKVYRPGRIRLRAFVDEPDLGQVARNQPVLIEWDGLSGRQWAGVVERPADQVVPLGNRSIGEVICSISGAPKELIPNLNVRVQIVTAAKTNALVIPRSAVFNQDGRPSVMVFVDGHPTVTAVQLGLVTPLEVEIVQGIEEGSVVATNPAVIAGHEGSARSTARN